MYTYAAQLKLAGNPLVQELETEDESSSLWHAPASSGILVNSSIVKVPEPSLSNFLNLRCSRLSSFSVTVKARCVSVYGWFS